MPMPLPSAKAHINEPVKTTGETVTVGCRLPNGIYMQLSQLVERDQDRPDGSRVKIKQAVAIGERVKINGNAKYRGGTKEIGHEIFKGAGLTFGVDANLFEKWLEANHDADFVKKGLIFAHRRDARGQAVEHAHEVSGLEPIDPQNPSPEFKRNVQSATGA